MTIECFELLHCDTHGKTLHAKVSDGMFTIPMCVPCSLVKAFNALKDDCGVHDAGMEINERWGNDPNR